MKNCKERFRLFHLQGEVQKLFLGHKNMVGITYSDILIQQTVPVIKVSPRKKDLIWVFYVSFLAENSSSNGVHIIVSTETRSIQLLCSQFFLRLSEPMTVYPDISFPLYPKHYVVKL